MVGNALELDRKGRFCISGGSSYGKRRSEICMIRVICIIGLSDGLIGMNDLKTEVLEKWR